MTLRNYLTLQGTTSHFLFGSLVALPIATTAFFWCDTTQLSNVASHQLACSFHGRLLYARLLPRPYCGVILRNYLTLQCTTSHSLSGSLSAPPLATTAFFWCDTTQLSNVASHQLVLPLYGRLRLARLLPRPYPGVILRNYLTLQCTSSLFLCSLDGSALVFATTAFI